MNLLPKTRNENIVVQNLDKETLIYDLKINKAFCLNETSAMVWQLCDGATSVAEISRQMSQQLKLLVTEDVVWVAIDELKKEGLLANDEHLGKHFQQQSRRQVIKAIGLATMVAMPIITGLIAPRAAQAQSDLCAGVRCDDNNACTIDSCDPATGKYSNILVTTCVDGNLCTTDRCDSINGCIYTPIICPGGQTCNPGTGICS